MLTAKEISKIGFQSFGRNLQISSKASFYNPNTISIGDDVRIDDFCILSGNIQINSFIHIGCFSSLIGVSKIFLNDFTNISSRVSIFSNNDDYSGMSLTGPMIDTIFKTVYTAPISIGKHCIIGCGSIILPGATLLDGVAIGSLSLVKPGRFKIGIYGGIPAKFIKKMSINLFNEERNFRNLISRTRQS